MRFKVLLQRSLDNLLANWPLLLIRLAEGIASLVLFLGSVLAVLIVLFGWAALRSADVAPFDLERIAQWIVEHPMSLLILIVVICLIAGVVLAIHSFVFGGITGVYIDGERLAGAGDGPRSRFHAFSMERWFRWAMRGWWPVFLIYNIAWGGFGLVLLVPATLVLGVMIVLPPGGGVIAVGCVGILAIGLVGLIGGSLVFVWSRLAIPLALGWSMTAIESLRRALEAARSNAVDLLLLFGVWLGASFGFGLVTMIFHSALGVSGLTFGLVPIFQTADFALSILQSLVSILLSTWLAAAFVSMVEVTPREAG